jgi:hypothetical protein
VYLLGSGALSDVEMETTVLHNKVSTMLVSSSRCMQCVSVRVVGGIHSSFASLRMTA